MRGSTEGSRDWRGPGALARAGGLVGAVAVSMARGPAAGLAIVDGLAADGLAGTYLLPAVRGELLARTGEARTEFASALDRCRNEAERAVLRRKLEAQRR